MEKAPWSAKNFFLSMSHISRNSVKKFFQEKSAYLSSNSEIFFGRVYMIN